MLKQTVAALLSRRWWWVTLLVILAIGVMARLSIWQLDRLQERRAANALLRQQLAAEPLSLNESDLAAVDLTAMPDRSVRAVGEYDFSEQILLQVQSYHGAAGAHLVAPLRLEGKEQAVLVDRGWIPDAQSDISFWSSFDEHGPVTVEGVIQRTVTARGVAPPATPQSHWFRVDVQAIQAQVPYELLPVYILQAPPAEGNQELPYRQTPQVDLSEGPHLGYAIQWALFAAMLAVGYVVFVARQQARPQIDTHLPLY